MTKTYRIAPLPSPPAMTTCSDETCPGPARFVRLIEYEGVQSAEYFCSRHSLLSHGFAEEYHWACARCGRTRREHPVFRSEQHGEVALCPGGIEGASFAVGLLVDCA